MKTTKFKQILNGVLVLIEEVVYSNGSIVQRLLDPLTEMPIEILKKEVHHA